MGEPYGYGHGDPIRATIGAALLGIISERIPNPYLQLFDIARSLPDKSSAQSELFNLVADVLPCSRKSWSASLGRLSAVYEHWLTNAQLPGLAVLGHDDQLRWEAAVRTLQEELPDYQTHKLAWEEALRDLNALLATRSGDQGWWRSVQES